ncbi:hypothetical protein HZA43_01410 [Candidatus Peregrinibacteria bacterium]|nr:hypothetical protein [Candidatus Peregrinibacteria bacterium]
MPTPTNPSGTPPESPAVPAGATPRDEVKAALSGGADTVSNGFVPVESVTAKDLCEGDILRVEAKGGAYEFEVSGFTRGGLVIISLNTSIRDTPFMEGEMFIWLPQGNVAQSAFHAEQFGRRLFEKRSLELAPVSGMKIKRAETK